MGSMSLVTLLNIPPQVSSTREESTLVISHATTAAAPRPSSGTKWWHYSPDQAVSSPQSENEAVGTSEEPPCLRQKDEMPFTKSLKGSQQEAFAKDSNLVWQAREDYFKTNCPHFNCKTLCDLSGVFWDMIGYADLLGFQIDEIQEVWMGPEDLWYADNALKTLPKDLHFSTLYQLRHYLRSWAWQEFITWMPFTALLGWTFALGVERRGRMKGL